VQREALKLTWLDAGYFAVETKHLVRRRQVNGLNISTFHQQLVPLVALCVHADGLLPFTGFIIFTKQVKRYGKTVRN